MQDGNIPDHGHADWLIPIMTPFVSLLNRTVDVGCESTSSGWHSQTLGLQETEGEIRDMRLAF
eukprot:scaffold421306_cov45-Attheya_sp.AAC.1